VTAAGNPSRFTAAQIAAAGGLTRQAVHSRLPDGECLSFAELPLEWQLEITRRGVQRGYQNGEDYLQRLPSPWKSPVAWAELPEKQQAKAVKLQKAMERALALRDDPAGSIAAGLEDFQRQFGYTISERQWRRLVNRTLERDAGEENWQRLEIYLDERALAKPTARREVARGEWQHRELTDVIATLENRAEPTTRDRQFIWNAVFHHFEAAFQPAGGLAEGTPAAKLFKRSLIAYLLSSFPAGTLCGSAKSLVNRFDEKLKLWRENGRTADALEDRRHIDSGKFRAVNFSADERKIRDLAIQLDGNKTLAHRMLRERGELSAEYCDYYPFDPRTDKSAMPAATANAITAEVEMTLPLRRGPWQARMRGPYIPRDWSGVAPGDWFCADDVTWNHYFKERAADGRWRVLRGECLVMTDLRTGYPLDFLQIAGHYNGEHVRSLVLRVHDQVGLPRKGFYFEFGVWASRLVRGDKKQGDPVHWREAQNGLAAAGVAVKHATTPRAKPIEGVFGIQQERMRSIPGFVGFNERDYDAERIQPLIARANRQDEAALAQFPTMEQWRDQVRAVLTEFAHDPQNGKMVQGKSPAEAWAEELRQRPLRKLGGDERYILSTHQKRVTVHQEGILLTIRGKRRLYFNEHTGRLIGQPVIAFYNLEMPDLLTVSDMNRQNFFSVKAVELPAMDATVEQLAEANRLRSAHMARAKAIYGEMRHEIVSTITRDNEHSEEVKELGRFHNAEVKRERTAQTARTRKLHKIQEQAAAEGIAVSSGVRNPDRVLAGMEMAREYRERIAREEAQADLENSEGTK
jgi:hypothetical protein